MHEHTDLAQSQIQSKCFLHLTGWLGACESNACDDAGVSKVETIQQPPRTLETAVPSRQETKKNEARAGCLNAYEFANQIRYEFYCGYQ